MTNTRPDKPADSGRYLMLPVLILFQILFPAHRAIAQDAVEAASSCVVIHEKTEEDSEKAITCFENVSLERSTFESGVCQWRTSAQTTANVQTTTRFVPNCPPFYSGFCDRLVLGRQVVAPVKIFIYDRSADVLDRARKQCLGGGGKWRDNDEESK